jgi:hypothetical protein
MAAAVASAAAEAVPLGTKPSAGPKTALAPDVPARIVDPKTNTVYLKGELLGTVRGTGPARLYRPMPRTHTYPPTPTPTLAPTSTHMVFLPLCLADGVCVCVCVVCQGGFAWVFEVRSADGGEPEAVKVVSKAALQKHKARDKVRPHPTHAGLASLPLTLYVGSWYSWQPRSGFTARSSIHMWWTFVTFSRMHTMSTWSWSCVRAR